MKLLEVKNLNYKYRDRTEEVIIFQNANAAFEKGRFYSVLGESGSGKTTLLSILAGLDERYHGEVLYNGIEIKKIGLDNYRRTAVSMIFQNYNLITHLNALDNIMLAMEISDNVKRTDRETIYPVLEELGINRRQAKRKVSSLSGGEQQRIAIARSIMTDAQIIVADEPTGNLDYKNSGEVISIFQKLAHEKNKCVIMVTHNERIKAQSDETYLIDRINGKIVKDSIYYHVDE